MPSQDQSLNRIGDLVTLGYCIGAEISRTHVNDGALLLGCLPSVEPRQQILNRSFSDDASIAANDWAVAAIYQLPRGAEANLFAARVLTKIDQRLHAKRGACVQFAGQFIAQKAQHLIIAQQLTCSHTGRGTAGWARL